MKLAKIIRFEPATRIVARKLEGQKQPKVVEMKRPMIELRRAA